MSQTSSLAEKWQRYRREPAEEYMNIFLAQEDFQRKCSIEDWDEIKKDIPKDSKCLDIGCGGMWFCSHLYDEGWKDVTGLSVDPRDLVQIKKEGDILLPTVEADACDMPLDDDSFDFVWSRQTFEHLMSPWLGLCEVHRILKPGGKLLLALPIDDDIMIYGESHLFVMGHRQWKNLLNKAGFKTVKIWKIERTGIYSEVIFFMEK